MKLLDFVSVASLLACVVLTPFAIIGWVKVMRGSTRDGLLAKSTVAWIALLILDMLSSGISTEIGKYRLGDFLDTVSPRCTVSIDRSTVPDAAPVLDALRRVGRLPAHHSDFGRIFDVVLSDPDPPRQLALWIARDHSDPHEYWVFFPSPSKLALRASLKTDIGHVKTTVFDDYGL